MSRDITYCVSSKCPKADTCDRWWANNMVGAFENISMFDPYKKGVKCEYEIHSKTTKQKGP